LGAELASTNTRVLLDVIGVGALQAQVNAEMAQIARVIELEQTLKHYNGRPLHE
jgi:hypothetical protein